MNMIIHRIALVLILVLLSVSASPRQRTTSEQEEKIVTSTRLVTVNVVVTDQKGNYALGLKREDFRIYDDGIKQQLSHFSFGADPISLGIVFEVHSSKPETSRAILLALRQLAASLREKDRFFFTAFAKQGSVETEFIPSLDQLLNHLTFVKPGGPSSLYDAIYASAARLRAEPNLRKTLLIVSDGEDHESITSYQRLRDRLRQFDVQVYAIGISDPDKSVTWERRPWAFEDVTKDSGYRPQVLDPDQVKGRAVLDEMSRVSGGATYFPETENEPDLTTLCNQIIVELRQQYTLGFYAMDHRSQRGSHQLKVTVNGANKARPLSLSYRQKYQSETRIGGR